MSTKTQPVLKMVPLAKIKIGTSNPRKVFDEDAITELAASVKAKGVIQPVLLRYTDDETVFELVCGERRYKASEIAGLTEIPAYIRVLDDDEALELQITENLQRKDVHPMEEAFAFKQLLERHSIEEVAARVGKKDYFINQRMKLNDLAAEWQKLFYNNFFNLSTALKIAVLPKAAQQEMLKDSGVNGKNVDQTKSVSINNYQLQQYSGALNKAPFDLADTSLDKKAGACVNCQFNSAVANLFPDSVKIPVCSNISCFKHKCDVSFDHELAKALEDPAIVFISTNYGLNDSKIADRLKKENHSILTRYGYNDAGIQDADIESYTEWAENEDDDANEEELKAQYGEYLIEQEKKKEQAQKKIASGKYLKAFIVDGTGTGMYKFIELQKRSDSKDDKKIAREKVESGSASASDIDIEIARIRDREKRSKELDGEKVHKLITEAMKTDKSLKALPSKVLPIDKILVRFLLAEYINYSNRDAIKKITGIDSNGYGYHDKQGNEKMYEKLDSLTDIQVSFLVRTIAFDKYNANLPTGSGGFMLRKLAESLGTITIDQFEAEQKERAAKRQKNVDKRIAELQEQKKILKPKAEPKSKTPAKKNAAKKNNK